MMGMQEFYTILAMYAAKRKNERVDWNNSNPQFFGAIAMSKIWVKYYSIFSKKKGRYSVH